MKPPRVRSILIAMTLIMVLTVLLGHRWLALGWNAWDYPHAAPSARTQIAIDRGRAYIAAGADGIEIIDLSTQKRRALVPSKAPADRIDDLAIADGWLFALG